MCRSDYWVRVVTLMVITFFAGFLGGYANFPENYFLAIKLASIIYMWVIGSDRMADSGHSQAWAIFAPFVIGTIVIGCLPTKKERLEGATYHEEKDHVEQ